MVRKDGSHSAEELGRLKKSAGVEELERDGYFVKYRNSVAGNWSSLGDVPYPKTWCVAVLTDLILVSI